MPLRDFQAGDEPQCAENVCMGFLLGHPQEMPMKTCAVVEGSSTGATSAIVLSGSKRALHSIIGRGNFRHSATPFA
jgi:hypothetical protein